MNAMTQVSIAPHPLTADALPAEGEIIGYTGPAFYGDDFGDHGPTSGPLRVGERTGGPAPGFFATALGFDGSGTDEVFVLFSDTWSPGRPATQTLHGYTLTAPRLTRCRCSIRFSRTATGSEPMTPPRPAMNTNKRERQTRHLVPDVAPSLDDLAATANHEHIMCTNASRTAVTHAITAGVALLSAREIVATGEWARWCERNFKGSYRTAIAYMRFATYRDHLQSTMTWAEAQAATSGLPDIRPRGGAVQYEDDLRAHAVALAREGRPQSEVAERLGVSQPSVSRWLDPDKRRRQNAASRALREKQRAALAATEREQEIKRAVRKAGAALSEAYSMSARMAKVLAQAEAEATTAEARAALADATGHYHRMQDAIVRALGVS